MARAFAVLACIAVLVGCAHGDLLKSWEGKPLDELYFAWGPPQQEKRLDDGRKVALYDHFASAALRCKVSVFASSESKIVRMEGEGTVGGCNQFLGGKSTGAR